MDVLRILLLIQIIASIVDIAAGIALVILFSDYMGIPIATFAFLLAVKNIFAPNIALIMILSILLTSLGCYMVIIQFVEIVIDNADLIGTSLRLATAFLGLILLLIAGK